jgi:hypothetical protein
MQGVELRRPHGRIGASEQHARDRKGLPPDRLGPVDFGRRQGVIELDQHPTKQDFTGGPTALDRVLDQFQSEAGGVG